METDPPGKRPTLSKVVVPDETMDWLIRQLKAFYVMNKRFHKGLKTGFTATSEAVEPKGSRKVWQTAVEFFLRHKLNMACCVRVRFLLASKHDIVPPNTIGLEKYLERYQQACEDMETELTMEFESQKQICRDYMLTTGDELGYKGRELTKFTLLNETLELTPLFRYCLAVSEGLNKVAKRYSSKAMGQYLSAPREYRRVWGKWLPEKLRVKARRLAGGWNYA